MSSAFYLEVVLKDHQSHMALSVQLGALLLESTPEECDIGPPNEANERCKVAAEAVP